MSDGPVSKNPLVPKKSTISFREEFSRFAWETLRTERKKSETSLRKSSYSLRMFRVTTASLPSTSSNWPETRFKRPSEREEPSSTSPLTSRPKTVTTWESSSKLSPEEPTDKSSSTPTYSKAKSTPSEPTFASNWLSLLERALPMSSSTAFSTRRLTNPSERLLIRPTNTSLFRSPRSRWLRRRTSTRLTLRSLRLPRPKRLRRSKLRIE